MKKILIILFIAIFIFGFTNNIFAAWTISKFSVSPNVAVVGVTQALINIGVEYSGKDSGGTAKITLQEQIGSGALATVEGIEEECNGDKEIKLAESSSKYVGSCDFQIPVIFNNVDNLFNASDTAARVHLTVNVDKGGLSKTVGVSVVRTQPIVADDDTIKGFEGETLEEVFDSISTMVFTIVSTIAFIMIIIGSFLMMTSGGDPQRVSKGRNAIYFAIIGFALASISKGIIALVQAIMGVSREGG